MESHPYFFVRRQREFPRRFCGCYEVQVEIPTLSLGVKIAAKGQPKLLGLRPASDGADPSPGFAAGVFL